MTNSRPPELPEVFTSAVSPGLTNGDRHRSQQKVAQIWDARLIILTFAFKPHFMFQIRKATAQDTPVIFDLIKKLAVYEKLEKDVVTTVEELQENIFTRKFAEVLMAEENGKSVGFALYFYNFSTFVGKPGIYLEDLFVEHEYRGKGYGKKLLIALAQMAHEKNCGRLEWSVLDWNTPAIEFYKSLGAQPMEGWTVFRLSESEIKNLATA